MRNYVKKSYFLSGKILPFLLILSVVFASMISMFSVNNVYAAAGEPAHSGEIFYIDTSRNTNWNVSSSATYDLYASFVKGTTILSNQVCTYNVGANSNLCSVQTPSAANGADKINLFVARKNTKFPDTASAENCTRVYFQNTSNWANVYAYAWTGSSKNAVFPGVRMEQISGTNYYYYDVPENYDNIIFSNGTNAAQTKDLVIPSTNNSLYVWNSSNTTSTKWAASPYILYDASVDLTSRENGANEIYVQSGNVATLSRYKYQWSPNDSNVDMVTIYLYNLNWYSSTGAAPWVTYDYADFISKTVQMTAVEGERGFYTVQVPKGATIMFRRTQFTNTQVSSRTVVPEQGRYNKPCYVMSVSSTDYWREKDDALSEYYDYYAENNFDNNSKTFNKNILGVEATYFDYLSDKELEGSWLKPVKAGTYDFNGAENNWYPFYKFNDEINKIAKNNSSVWNYPLYFGNFVNNDEDHNGTYASATSSLTNFNYFANNSNGLIDGSGNSGTDEAFSASIHGLAYSKLDQNGNIQYADGGSSNSHTMPYFDSKWLHETTVNGKSIGKTVKSYFPFEATQSADGVTKYIFNSASSTDNRKDNVYFTWDKNGNPETVNYGYGDSYSVRDGLSEFMYNTASGYGLFPFNNTSSETNAKNPGNGNLDYGFGVRLDIEFRVPEDGKLANGQDVTFNFKGDDDVWVYITDPDTNESKLALDLGGVHKQTVGNINFNTMKATDEDVNEFSSGKYALDRIYISATGDYTNWGPTMRVWAWTGSNGEWYTPIYDSSVGKYYIYKSQLGSSNNALSTKTTFKVAKDTSWSAQTGEYSLNDYYGYNTYLDNMGYKDGGSELTYKAKTTRDIGFEKNTSGTYKHLDPNKTYKMTVFYMERGMIESNFNIDFTMTPANNDVKVNKEVRTQVIDDSGVTTDIVNHALVNAVKENSSFSFIPYENGKQVSGSDTYTYTVNEGAKQYVSVSNPTFKLSDGDTADFDGEFTQGNSIHFEEKVGSGIQYNTTWEVHDVKNDKLISKSDEGTSSTSNTPFNLINTQNSHNDAEFLVNFINTPKTADVSLKKLVQDKDGSELSDNTDTFAFYVTVDLNDGKGFQPYALQYRYVSKDDEGNNITEIRNARARDGYLTFSTGDNITLLDIPVGAKIKIVEGTKAGYIPVECTVTGSDVNSNNFSKDRTVEVTVVADTDIVFTNKQNPTTASLSAVKLLDDENYTGSLFSFNLEGLAETKYTASTGNEVTTQDLTGQSLTINSVQNGNISFVNNTSTNEILNFKAAGVYRYKLYEKTMTDNPDNAYITDSSIYLAEITVTENGASLVPGDSVYYKTPDTVTSETSDDELQKYFSDEYKLTETPTPVFSNTTQKGKVTVNKTNQNSEDLSGVEFTIYKTTGENGELGDVYMSDKTDENGQIVFDNIQIFKDGYQSSGNPEYQWYCLVESSPKDGYSINAEKHYFKLPMSGDDGDLHYDLTYSYVNGKVIIPNASGSGMNGYIVAGALIIGLCLVSFIGYMFFLNKFTKRRMK